MKSLANLRSAEVARGYSLAGPHRDDLEFLLNGRSMRLFASQGQQRTAVIALKVGIVQWVTDRTGEAPVLLLDDVLSELDPDRQRELSKLWKNVQIFVTSADPDRVLGDPKGPEERETVRVDLNHKDAEDRWM